MFDHNCHNRAGGLGSRARRDAERLKKGLIPPPPYNPVPYRLHHFHGPSPSVPAPSPPVPTPAPPTFLPVVPSTPRAEDRPITHGRSTPASPCSPPWPSLDSHPHLASPPSNPQSPSPRSPSSPIGPNLENERAAALALLSFGREATVAAASAFAIQYGGDPYDYDRAVQRFSSSRSLRADNPIENVSEASDIGLHDHQRRGETISSDEVGGVEQAVDLGDGVGEKGGEMGEVGDPDVNEDNMDLDSEDGNSYPLDGKYRNEKDREILHNLPELERELILADRLEKRQIPLDRIAVDALYRAYRATQVDGSEAAGTEGAESEDEGGTNDRDAEGTDEDDENGARVGSVGKDVDPVGGNEVSENREDGDGEEGQASEVERPVVYRRRTVRLEGVAGEENVDDQDEEEEEGGKRAQRVRVSPDMSASDVLGGLNRMIEGQRKYFRKDVLHGYKIKMTVRTMGERKRTEILIQAYRHCGGNAGIFAQTGSSGTYKGVKEHWIANPLSDLDRGIMNDFKRSNVAFYPVSILLALILNGPEVLTEENELPCWKRMVEVAWGEV
ncbi:hypothetical protein QFC21_007321 [Naganishia friedmannii]|uniref:Uncharacterized protein n=1 Tax=Naganishia friedmannii TaxID=89922 RepID=A0ACC2UWF4_9TREE|nr:hypothetical protein QFC21_007321 [Naganishia friedmannii]